MRDLWESHSIFLDASSAKGNIKEIFCIKNVGSGNINLGKDIAENLILLVPILFNYDSLLCVLQLSGIFV